MDPVDNFVWNSEVFRTKDINIYTVKGSRQQHQRILTLSNPCYLNYFGYQAVTDKYFLKLMFPYENQTDYQILDQGVHRLKELQSSTQLLALSVFKEGGSCQEDQNEQTRKSQ